MTYTGVLQRVPSVSGLQVSLMAKPSMAFAHLRFLILPIAFKEAGTHCVGIAVPAQRERGRLALDHIAWSHWLAQAALMNIYKKGGAKEFQGCRLLAMGLFVPCPPQGWIILWFEW